VAPYGGLATVEKVFEIKEQRIDDRYGADEPGRLSLRFSLVLAYDSIELERKHNESQSRVTPVGWHERKPVEEQEAEFKKYRVHLKAHHS
jgi:hypothetical protein